MNKYQLVDSFPKSLSKYRISLIAEILVQNNQLNPCEIMYEKEDLRKSTSVDEIIESLAFDHTDKTRLFLDTKNHYFKSRRISSLRLSDYLTDKYKYDTKKVREFKQDKNSLFIILFYEIYNGKTNEIDYESLTEARMASYRFKEKRDRMANVEYSFDFNNIRNRIPEFKKVINSDIAKTKVDTYNSKNEDIFRVMFRQKQNRKVVPKIKERQDSIEVEYTDNYPVEETVLEISRQDNGSYLKLYSSVSKWDETLMRFFTTVTDKDFTEELSTKDSKRTKEIMEQVKQNTRDNEDDLSLAGNKVETITKDVIEESADNIKTEDSDYSQAFIKKKVNDMLITGIEVDSDDTKFELKSEKGIEDMLSNYKGMSASLAEAVKNVDIDDIKIYAKVPSSEGSDKKSEIIMSNGEWYISSGGDKSTIDALEKVL